MRHEESNQTETGTTNIDETNLDTGNDVDNKDIGDMGTALTETNGKDQSSAATKSGI